jgi:hypothetical protein
VCDFKQELFENKNDLNEIRSENIGGLGELANSFVGAAKSVCVCDCLCVLLCESGMSRKKCFFNL